ncbi:Outer-membrane lipoprotein carrier protein [Gammaproteobacteria bacterium]
MAWWHIFLPLRKPQPSENLNYMGYHFAMRRIGHSSAFFLLLAIFTILQWNSAQAEVSDSLHAFLKDLHNLRADFQQTEYDEHHNEVRQSQGTLHLQRPGRFRWEYQTPYLQTIVSDSAQVWFYDPDLAQVTVKPYDRALANSPALLLSSDEPLENNFQLVETGTRVDLQWVELRPKKPETGFVKAELGFMGKELRAMELIDNFGQTTNLKFFNLQRNLSLTAELFHFSPPPGVDVIGEKH